MVLRRTRTAAGGRGALGRDTSPAALPPLQTGPDRGGNNPKGTATCRQPQRLAETRRRAGPPCPGDGRPGGALGTRSAAVNASTGLREPRAGIPCPETRTPLILPNPQTRNGCCAILRRSQEGRNDFQPGLVARSAEPEGSPPEFSPVRSRWTGISTTPRRSRASTSMP